MYLNFFLTSLVEIPGNAFAIYAMNRLVCGQLTENLCLSMLTWKSCSRRQEFRESRNHDGKRATVTETSLNKWINIRSYNGYARAL